ncbi:MAG: hypothetical protein LQ352_003112, partial [Teloschistes flavicans]
MQGNLHHFALRAILLEHSQWHQTFTTINSSLNDGDLRIVSFGPERCVPPSFIRTLNVSRITHVEDIIDPSSDPESDTLLNQHHPSSKNDIAVIGMSCNVAGADDLEAFWKILIDGKSQHTEVSGDRFGFETVFREAKNSTGSKWFGNFIEDYDAFDHKFFKRSPREAASMDPQQRLLLQVAYQAVEQSGYFQSTKPDAAKEIGCYIGVCATDYENNIACHAPNAFSATGNLRSFIAGKISHYFGWTGPGLTVDTACSASAVAIHQACTAILSGECTAALAGGTNMITQPLWFQNLAAASFLSPTGQCKPFDAKADGYCRGEAVATVFLKKMSSALADGDQIFGTISATAVLQNQNCTPIFVPNAPSLSDLFRRVIRKSGLGAKQISVVEAHGTGTPVGDPAEYDSIRQVLGGISRPRNLQFGSVKGLVGHTEGTSGVVSLIKVLLMIQEGFIPPQASFSTMSPGIPVLPSDNMEVTTELRSWDDDFRAALINNYGAAGSNASLVVTQAPHINIKTRGEVVPEAASGSLNYPFWFTGSDDRSIRAYSTRFRGFLKSKVVSAKSLSIQNLSFNVSRQSNRSLDRGLIFSCQTIDELDQKLAAFEAGESTVASTVRPAARSVILCFGGQISTFVGLDRHVYEGITVLRHHLNECDSICRSLGVGSIYPGIFHKEPEHDPVRLQTMLFAVQYASAKSWIDCGVQPVAVVGHSFGELTALCISDVLSLRDALKMIVARSTIIRDSWSSDKGTMLAVEAGLDEVKTLLAESSVLCTGKPAAVACFNGPRSFTLAGPVQSIEAVVQTISTNPAYQSMLSKVLNVTHAYHSTLVEPLTSELEKAAQHLTFNEPKIQLERATESTSSTERLTSRFLADHMRDPVYFNHAVQRLAKQYPSSIWLEASSNATVTTMASRALGAPKECHFQPVSLSGSHAMQKLTETVMNLWKAGQRVTHWAHSALQTHDYAPIFLPPYQFDKPRHWMAFSKPPKAAAIEAGSHDQIQPKEEVPTTLCTFMGYQDGKQQHARFRINTTIQKYQGIVSGHVIAQTAPICPATLQVDMVIENLMSLQPELTTSNLVPQIRAVVNEAPICNDPSRSVWMDFERLETDDHTWDWTIRSNGPQSGTTMTRHATGEIVFRSADDPQYQLEFGRYERLVQHQRCLQVLEGEHADDIVQGRSIYKMFSDVVDYGEMYFGLRKLVGSGNESAGYVVKKHSSETWLDPFLGDCFSQVGGIWVNCLTEKKAGDIFIANGFEQWVRSPRLAKDSTYQKPESWHVYAHHDRAASGNAYLTDIFVFDATTGILSEVIMGINYQKVPKLSMSKLLSRLTAAGSQESRKSDESVLLPVDILSGLTPTVSQLLPQTPQIASPAQLKPKASSSSSEISGKLKLVLADISGLETDEIKDNTELADIGIDSLLGMEMAREIEGVFKCTLDQDELMHVTNVPSLLRCLFSALGIVDQGPVAGDEDSDGKGDFLTQDSSSASSIAPSPSSSTTSVSNGMTNDLKLPSSTILEAFEESKELTDRFIRDHRCAGYLDNVMPKQTELCITLTVEAFKQLGCDLESASAGQRLERIPHLPEHGRLAEYLYMMLEETRIIDRVGSLFTRTAISLPSKTSGAILDDLDREYPDHTFANQLSHWTGSRLADVLSGKADGIKLIFASDKGRQLVAGLYGDSLLNKLAYQQMADFLNRLVSKLPKNGGPLKILEMGAGTGGTTKWLLPLLATVGIPVEYTFTDLSSSFVAGARKRFKEYPFMSFLVHDIEKPPGDKSLFYSQHIVLASNAVHATHSLTESTKNIHKFLRPDGFLMMLEMTETLYWVDLIFGVLEGWWLFDDGRRHAIAHESCWDRELHSAGYGHVDWTDGSSPEVNIQRVFIALASGPRLDRLPAASSSANNSRSVDYSHAARQAATEEYIQKSALGFSIPPSVSNQSSSSATTVLITGATGSLGSHLVEYLANLPTVNHVICLNRRNSTEPTLRQHQALSNKAITLSSPALAKLQVLEADLAKPSFGLPHVQYQQLCNTITHIIHNAWPMSGKLPLKGFATQFQAMRNLIDLASQCSSIQHDPHSGRRITFQLVSSIATVGHYPLSHSHLPNPSHIPEERTSIPSVLPNGYGDAKFVCERILDETLHRHPERFRAMVVRLGQVAGSRRSGYWNPMEHFSMMVKSAQTLRMLPDLKGVASWTCVEDVAATLSDLIFSSSSASASIGSGEFYHIDNPVRQPWRDLIPILASELDIPPTNIVPFDKWIEKVKRFWGSEERDNPARKLAGFLEEDFERMSCGGVMMGTER